MKREEGPASTVNNCAESLKRRAGSHDRTLMTAHLEKTDAHRHKHREAQLFVLCRK